MVETGIEWAILNNWLIKAEYDFIDFGNKTTPINGTVLPGLIGFPVAGLAPRAAVQVGA